ncbi:MAG TPA: SDR family oxidoreductase [Pyrinomonadaceae bacterium]|jgi:short-subunit dehydrogenase
MKLKKISEQTIVITGATSGIGLTTARMAAEMGAKLVLVARNEDALRELADEINSQGGRAIYHAADVAAEYELREAANRARAEFGGFDTWVNNAGGSIYGRIMEVPTEDLRRLFETNVWGVVNGSKIAVEHLRERGGALVNVGSEVSDAVVPIQGMYSASKHAVKAFTEALRMELEADGFPISVSLVKPTAINTPFPQNAKNYLPYEPDLPSPVYAPELVAEAILYCAENPMPEFFVGETAKLHSTMTKFMPRIGEKLNEMTIDSSQNSGEPAKRNRRDGLYDPNSNLRERGKPERFTMEYSAYHESKMHPFITGALAVGAGLGIAAWLGSRKKYSDEHHEPRRSFAVSTVDASQIAEHAEVLSADGQHVGTVDHVQGNQIKLTRRDSTDAKHHFIPLAWVASASGGEVRLNRNAYVVRGNWGTGEGATAQGAIAQGSTAEGGKPDSDDVMTAGDFGRATGGV